MDDYCRGAFAPFTRGKTKADVCVAGAGIAGMNTAYLLARENKKVAVLDDGAIGGGGKAVGRELEIWGKTTCQL